MVGVILCGWCGYPTEPPVCSTCHHDPRSPYEQRGVEPTPAPVKKPGRPTVDGKAKLAEARAAGAKTDDEIAAFHGVDPRTVRHWKGR